MTGNIEGNIKAFPPRLTFSGVVLGKEEKREFTLKRSDGELIEIEKIVPDREEVKVEVVGEAKGSLVPVNVTLKLEQAEPSLVRMGGTIKVYTNDPQQPVLDVLYYIYFARKPAARPTPVKR